MSIQQFYDLQTFNTFTNNQELFMGKFQTQQDEEIAHIVAKIFIFGSISENESLRVNIYSESTRSNLIYQSDRSYLRDINNISSNWLGFIKMDFDRQNINADYEYFPYIEIENYTRTALFWVGVKYDYPDQINDTSATSALEAALEYKVYGYR